jgi:hypothetical protein
MTTEILKQKVDGIHYRHPILEGSRSRYKAAEKVRNKIKSPRIVILVHWWMGK